MTAQFPLTPELKASSSQLNVLSINSLSDAELLQINLRGAGFLNELKVKPQGPYHWELLEELSYVTMLHGHPFTIFTVPTGFITDLASIPRPLQPFAPVNGRHREEAAVHDYLTGRNKNFNRKGEDGIDRRLCDKIFYEGMDLSGVPVVRRYAMLGAVRGYSFFFTRV